MQAGRVRKSDPELLVLQFIRQLWGLLLSKTFEVIGETSTLRDVRLEGKSYWVFADCAYSVGLSIKAF